jgi:hypothetical protein
MARRSATFSRHSASQTWRKTVLNARDIVGHNKPQRENEYGLELGERGRLSQGSQEGRTRHSEYTRYGNA